MMITLSVIGLGNRGSVYSDLLMEEKEAKIVSVCDLSPDSLRQAKELYKVTSENIFDDPVEFFKEKRSDILVVTTMDKLHREHAITGMKLGYDILLEKPIAPTYEDVMAIYEASIKYGRDVVICHNLRYSPFYDRIKRTLMDNTIGKVLSIEHSENVSYWHYMCSFVRGKWHVMEEASPMVLAKCCHDLDLLTWFIGNISSKTNSFGNLTYYKKINDKADSAELCVDCKHKECIYNSMEFFMKEPGALCTPYGFVKTYENIKNYLSDKDNDYAKCVFKMNNDMCDRQVVSIKYDNGITASLLLHGFEPVETDRYTKIYGEDGILTGEFNKGLIKIEKFNGETLTIDVNDEIKGSSHNGADKNLVADYVYYKTTGIRPLGISKIEDSIKSHTLAFEAEASRLVNENSGLNLSVEVSDYSLSGSFKEFDEIANSSDKIGSIQVITSTLLSKEENLDKNINDIVNYCISIASSNLKNYDCIYENSSYKHGFIDLMFENGIIFRMSFVTVTGNEKYTIKAFGINGAVEADTDNHLMYQSAVLRSKPYVNDNHKESKIKSDTNEFINKIIK